LKAIHDTGQPENVREIIAQRIIEAASRGKRDPDRLVGGSAPLASRRIISGLPPPATVDGSEQLTTEALSKTLRVFQLGKAEHHEVAVIRRGSM
jgi:hypothetical protein